jgi:hypothetical protein
MSELVEIVAPLGSHDFAPTHPMRKKGGYFKGYAIHVLRGIESLGKPVVSVESLADKFLVDWRYDDGSVVTTGVCYSDFPAIAIDYWRGVDLLLKTKWHPGRTKNDLPFPVASGGAVALTDELQAPGLLEELRAMKDGRQIDRLFYTNFTFRTFGGNPERAYPNRVRFKEWAERRPALTGADYLRALATHRWMLNVCGSGSSIDRKVVDACAIGCAIVSDRGLEDLELPWGGRFVHGENVWFVDGPEDVGGAIEQITGDCWRKLVAGARRIYDEHLAPRRLGKWFLNQVESVR